MRERVAPALRTIDGSRGEGGGQVARTALALAAATREPVRVTNIRANREQRGLKASHVAAVRAVAQICDGEIDGAELGSTEVTLRPGVVTGGAYEFAIETAGPVTLLFQALLPAIVASRQRFDVTLRGGTNVAWAPQWDDLVLTQTPMLRQLGIEVAPTLVKRGYFPQGGGEVRLDVEAPGLRRAVFDEPGALRRVRGIVSSHGLPRHVMDRALVTTHALDDLHAVTLDQDFHRGPGTGMAIALAAEFDRGTVLGADAVGKKGTRVETVVEEATDRLREEVRAGVGVDVHQADQLPVLMALAGGGSYTCRVLSPHARTVLDLIPEFLPVRVETQPVGANVRVLIASGERR